MDSDRRELTDDMGIVLRANNDALQSTMWTALPGFITKYDPVKNTCEVQPTIQAVVLTAQGKKVPVTMPLLVDCPVIFPSGGGFTLTFPLAVKDEVLVIFSSRCIDSWWHSGGIQVQAELRMHDLSDGFILPGPKSVPNVVPSISATDVQLRNTAGNVRIGIKANGDIEVLANGTAKTVAPNILLQGNVVITGSLSVAGVAGGAAAGSALKVNDIATPLLPSYKLHNHKVLGGFTDIPFPGS